MKFYDYLIVGAGPAGLAFGSSLESSSVILVDCGKSVSERDRYDSIECLQGEGGAGLFSDGKFSFFPAGTEIWKHEEWAPREAYRMMENDLGPFGSIPPFPDLNCQSSRILGSSGWCLKPYHSIYISLKDRMQLIQKLSEKCFQISYQTEFVKYEEEPDIIKVFLKDTQSSTLYQVRTKHLILAGGRFNPLFLSCIKRFRRYEFGFRIVGPTSIIRKKVHLKDPKYVYDSKGMEFRTFCWCENGEVVKTSFNGIETFSGRADCDPTGITNFGFNIRVKNPSLISKSDFEQMLLLKPYEVGIRTFIQNLGERFNAPCASMMAEGCNTLFEIFPELLCDEVTVVGPTIEGVGYYPHVGDHFELTGSKGIFVLGDCSGTYRGIIPSMLSGYTLAVLQNNSLISDKQERCMKDVICR